MAQLDRSRFLPQLLAVFYANFDIKHGPKLVHQVPEGVVASVAAASFSSESGPASFASSPVPSTQTSSRASSVSRPPASAVAATAATAATATASPFADTRALFRFDDVSKYVIPPSSLCGRLVVCSARRAKILGFPVELRGAYARNYFRFNVCLVFDPHADLACYEPIVRKISRVLATCERESAFLSAPDAAPRVLAVLEQIYEDLNSYAETSIPIDNFNSIELKLFPCFPNPPPVHDWQVPLALINLARTAEQNWDLTIAKICPFIDGTRHVARIAHLAHCDLELTRQAIAHLLYYQVIMTIDLFQYSNMYTLRKSVQWLAEEPHVQDECGPYTVREGKSVPDWPQLLHLYSRLKPGKSVFDWMQEHDVRSLGIDARRFTSFGVIKGFLRRVHRWPVFLDDTGPAAIGDSTSTSAAFNTPHNPNRRRSMSIPTPGPSGSRVPPLRTNMRRPSDAPTPTASISTDAVHGATSPVAPRRPSTPSAAEISLGQQLHSRAGSGSATGSWGARHTPPSPPTLRTFRIGNTGGTNAVAARESRRGSLNVGPTHTPDGAHAWHADAPTRPQRPRMSRSPSGPAATIQTIAQTVPPPAPPPGSSSSSSYHASAPYPNEFLKLLDGEHHTDELCTRFGVGFPTLERWLVHAGGGRGEGDLGKVLIVYR